MVATALAKCVANRVGLSTKWAEWESNPQGLPRQILSLASPPFLSPKDSQPRSIMTGLEQDAQAKTARFRKLGSVWVGPHTGRKGIRMGTTSPTTADPLAGLMPLMGITQDDIDRLDELDRAAYKKAPRKSPKPEPQRKPVRWTPQNFVRATHGKMEVYWGPGPKAPAIPYTLTEPQKARFGDSCQQGYLALSPTETALDNAWYTWCGLCNHPYVAIVPPAGRCGVDLDLVQQSYSLAYDMQRQVEWAILDRLRDVRGAHYHVGPKVCWVTGVTQKVAEKIAAALLRLALEARRQAGVKG